MQRFLPNCFFCCFLLLLLAAPLHAQVPPWVLATAGGIGTLSSGSKVQAVATDASGNVLVTGSFTGQLLLGSTTLTSAGQADLFIAKYAPASNTWLWAVRGGGLGNDQGNGIASSGGSVYITGAISNTLANAYSVTFASGSQGTGTAAQAGASLNYGSDLVVAKYTDNGPSATLAWTQVAGGTENVDQGNGIAVSGNGVYVIGSFYSNTANTQQVMFGGAGTTPGTWPQVGSSPFGSTDWVLAKYLDQGSTATVAWTQAAGGLGTDYGQALAVSGTSVYATGTINNTLANGNSVVFGGTNTTPGTAAQYGASATPSFDLAVAKYTDNGPSATLNWTQVGGGTGPDVGNAVAVKGQNVYVTGSFFNDLGNSFAAVFGGSGATPGTTVQYGAALGSIDFLLLKYTDNGPSATLRWTQIGGGSSSDNGFGVAAGTSGPDVYVAGRITTTAANTNGVVFGGTGAAPGTTAVPGTGPAVNGDLLLAKYTDNGATATLNWTQTGGGSAEDQGLGLALSGSRLYVGGSTTPPATFGPLAVNVLASVPLGFLGGLDLSGTLATAPGAGGARLRLYPNPTPGAATLSGATPGTPVGIFDALGRRVATATADATGATALPTGLSPGLYLVRAGASTVRWAVE